MPSRTISPARRLTALASQIATLNVRQRTIQAEVTKATIVRGLRACGRAGYDLALIAVNDDIDGVIEQQPGKRTITSIWGDGDWLRATFGRLDVCVNVSEASVTLTIQYANAPADPDIGALIVAIKAFMKDLGVRVTGLALHDQRAEKASGLAILDAIIAAVDAP